MLDAIVNYLAGWNVLALVLLVIGLGLVTVEMFLPGFGICGISGVGCLIACIVVSAKSITQAFITLVLIIAIVVLLGYIVFKNFGRVKSPIVLKDRIDSASTELSNDDIKSLEGKCGVAETALRPVGKATIDGKQYDVVTSGEFVNAAQRIEVVSVKGLRILVRKVDDES